MEGGLIHLILDPVSIHLYYNNKGPRCFTKVGSIKPGNG